MMGKEKRSLGSPAPPAEVQLTQLSDGKLTAREMHPDIDEAALMRKIDMRVIPMLCMVYLFAFLDRVNIANAAVYGMSHDLGLTGNQYNIALTIFFAPYILFEVPGNLLLKHFRPRVWIPSCMFVFGCITIAQGLVKNYGGLLAARFFLGVVEAGIFPGCIYLISMWYKREVAQKRFTAFITSASLAGAFGGLFAYAISKLDGAAGLASWRWVFVIEGLMTIVFAAVASFFIADFPEEVKWLSDDERAFVNARLAEEFGDSQLDAKQTWRDVLGVLKDFKIILSGFTYFGLLVPGYSYAFFAPTILQSFGYTPVMTQLYSVPPMAAAFVLNIVVAIFSDYYKRRYIFVLPALLVSAIGIIVLLNVHEGVRVRYGALVLVAVGASAAAPIIVCWFGANLGGHLRRSVGTAFQIGFGTCAVPIATFSVVASDAPKYTRAYSLSLGFICFTAICCTLYLLALIYENRKRAMGRSEHSGKSREEKEKPGDLNPDYRYML